MEISEKEIGQMSADIKNIGVSIETLNRKMDTSISFQSATEERLKSGSKTFKDHRDTLDSHEKDIERVKLACVERCATQPSGKTVYALITVGFVILGLLLKFIPSPSFSQTTVRESKATANYAPERP